MTAVDLRRLAGEVVSELRQDTAGRDIMVEDRRAGRSVTATASCWKWPFWTWRPMRLSSQAGPGPNRDRIGGQKRGWGRSVREGQRRRLRHAL